MLGLLSTLFEMNTERSCVVRRRRRRGRGKFSSHRNWRSWGKRSRWWRRLPPPPQCQPGVQKWFYSPPVCLLTVGVSGNAKAAGHSAPAGAGEGEADAPGAAEAHHPDESPNACFLSPLCPGTLAHSHLTSELNQQHEPVVLLNVDQSIPACERSHVTAAVCLSRRCSLCRPMWREGWCTKPVLRPVTQVLSAPQVLWRVHLCTTSIWTSRGRRLPRSTKLCPVLPRVRVLATILMTTDLCLSDFYSCLF